MVLIGKIPVATSEKACPGLVPSKGVVHGQTSAVKDDFVVLCFPVSEFFHNFLAYYGVEILDLHPTVFIKLSVFEWAMRIVRLKPTSGLFAEEPVESETIVNMKQGDFLIRLGLLNFKRRPVRKSHLVDYHVSVSKQHRGNWIFVVLVS